MAGSFASAPAAAAEQMAGKTVEVWKSPSCGCCGGWVTHMREAGFQVTVHEVDDVDPVKAQQGVPAPLHSCHTALVDGYVLEGHVPASDVKRLLTERPKARGLSVPGMPQDAPGMDMKTGTPYQTVLFGTADGKATVYARH
ncbi:DUF411 domain-containing protein [Azospirillum thermophilum]|nr:DUF411 domain-containing protein [Azospirillum thermophilum]